MSNEINRYKLHAIVEYIRNSGEGILFDTADLFEYGVTEIIKQYNLFYQLTQGEKDVLFQDLFGMALRMEMAEVTRSMNPDEFLAVHGGADPLQVCPEVDSVPVGEGPILA